MRSTELVRIYKGCTSVERVRDSAAIVSE